MTHRTSAHYRETKFVIQAPLKRITLNKRFNYLVIIFDCPFVLFGKTEMVSCSRSQPAAQWDFTVRLGSWRRSSERRVVESISTAPLLTFVEVSSYLPPPTVREGLLLVKAKRGHVSPADSPAQKNKAASMFTTADMMVQKFCVITSYKKCFLPHKLYCLFNVNSCRLTGANYIYSYIYINTIII